VLRCAGQGAIVAIVEFSFDLTSSDLQRFAGHGIALEPLRSCRWGLCGSEEWRRRGVGTALAPPCFEIATRFGRTCIILLGGVHAANTHAIAYYRRLGFTEAGHFTNGDGTEAIDMLRHLARVPGGRGRCP
jgi:ribosomal protein S18 acetylase RimI-like enzyme